MTLNQFVTLNRQEQAQAAWQGAFLMFREHYEHTVLLYKLSNFYVEVFYDRQHHSINKVKAYKTRRFLKSYFLSYQN